jgi:hypothetical protein
VPRNPDPKHGRWILPLLITAMVVLTFTFVNSLEPTGDAAGTTTTTAPTTTAPSTTTTMPAEITTFITSLDAIKTQLTAFGTQVDQANSDWEARATSGVTYDGTHTAFTEAKAAIIAWEETAADTSAVPADFAQAHVQLVLVIGELPARVDDILLGLEASDDGSLRRAAVTAFDQAIQASLTAVDALKTQVLAAAGGGESTTTTGAGGSSTTGGETTTTTAGTTSSTSG